MPQDVDAYAGAYVMATFMLYADGRARLRSYTATSKAGRHTLKIEVEYTTAVDMGFDVEHLDEIAAAMKAARAPKPAPKPAKPRAIAAQRPLMLPAPEE
ncbi:hypothetical protein CCR83_03935 [Rhodobacter veldkampii DSM 11550]|uniref:Uncharacterized protein n=2 Tax=Phaeovulum veldkampii TaxID=33049 RepID=A0A2T4JH39_9RHOB|nr:hypothetical protein [Phaeovulum veldkampii DSM 11550]PTE17229.1 hypothetical protein C5F46_10080 [Phaeovulum veldkampii DSM 11550]